MLVIVIGRVRPLSLLMNVVPYSVELLSSTGRVGSSIVTKATLPKLYRSREVEHSRTNVSKEGRMLHLAFSYVKVSSSVNRHRLGDEIILRLTYLCYL